MEVHEGPRNNLTHWLSSTQVLGLALAANGRLLEALPVFREALQVTRRRAVFSDDKLDRFLARRLNDRAIFAARQAVFTCCDLLGRGAATACVEINQ